MTHKVFDCFRQMALSLPGMIESTSYGTPSFKIRNKLIARLHEDGDTLVLKMDFETRDFLLQVNPNHYYITDHYNKYPFVLVNLDNVDLNELKGHLHSVWKTNANKKQLKEFEETTQ
jgi:hypothetical protein